MLRVTMATLVVLILLITFELLRRRALREKYAFVWIMTALLLIFGSLFPNLMIRISTELGFITFSNFVIVLFGVILLFITMQLSLELGKVEDQSQRLAEEVALLKNKLEKDINL